jgi:hypothetical protein
MHRHPSQLRRSISSVAADSCTPVHGHGASSFAPQWNAAPQRGQVSAGVMVAGYVVKAPVWRRP